MSFISFAIGNNTKLMRVSDFNKKLEAYAIYKYQINSVKLQEHFDECHDQECATCSIFECPYEDPFHRDNLSGCPSCLG